MSESNRGLRRRLVVMVRVAAAALVLGGLAIFGSAAFSASSPTAETAPAVISKATGTGSLSSGGSTTPWTIDLPANSHCSGDTHTGGFLVYSYMTAADPATLSFSVANASGGPSSGYSLWETLNEGQNVYAAIATSITTGFIPQTPSLDYSLFSVSGTGGTTFALPLGAYNVGIACAQRSGALDQFWNTQVVFTASSSDPAGEVWAVAGSTTTTTTVAGTTTTTAAGSGTTTTTLAGSGTTTTTTGTGGANTTTAGAGGGTTPASTDALAVTGTSVITMSDWGALMILVGFVIILGTRRRGRDGRP